MSESKGERGHGKGAAATEAEATTWEWVISGISTLLVLCTVGYVFYKAVAEPTTPPEVVVEVDEIHDGAVGYVLTFWAHNVGGRTAKDLTIEGQLVSDTGVVATRSAGITFIPGGSRRKGGLFFPVDPRLYEVQLYPVGYDVP